VRDKQLTNRHQKRSSLARARSSQARPGKHASGRVHVSPPAREAARDRDNKAHLPSLAQINQNQSTTTPQHEHPNTPAHTHKHKCERTIGRSQPCLEHLCWLHPTALAIHSHNFDSRVNQKANRYPYRQAVLRSESVNPQACCYSLFGSVSQGNVGLLLTAF
jgi:hypothetical protein